MATKTATKKGSSKKKAAGKKAPAESSGDPLDELAAEIDQDLGAEALPETSEAEGGEVDLMGKQVRLQDDQGEIVEGRVTAQNGTAITVETADAFLDTTTDNDSLEVLEEGGSAPAEEKASGKKASGKKGGKKKGDASAEAPPLPAAPAAPAEQDPRLMEVRLIKLTDIKIPAAKPRDFVEDEKFKKLVANIKSVGRLTLPIEVSDFDKPTLVDGLCRMKAYEQLGWDVIPATLGKELEDPEDRLWRGLMANEQRKGMRWPELARCFAQLVKGGKYTQRAIAKALPDFSESDVSRMIACVKKLPKKALELAEAKPEYTWSVWAELADHSDQKEVVDHVLAAVEEGKGVTMRDVRALAKEAEKEAKRKAREEAQAKGEEVEEEDDKPARGRSSAPAAGLTYRDLSVNETGRNVKIRVNRDTVEFKITVDWTNKTFRGFETMKELKAVFDAAFAAEDTSVEDFDGLTKAMGAAKAELG